MTSVWAQPPLELLQHAEAHKASAAAPDQRIAFLSVDNAFETVLSVYLEVIAPEDPKASPLLPNGIPRSFPARLAAVETIRPELLTRAELLDVEYYHRMRNHLYHHGIGGGVSEATTSAYFSLAVKVFEALLSEKFVPQGNRLEHLTFEARSAFEKDIQRRASAKHGAKTRAGAEKAKQEGIIGYRGRPATGVMPDEIPILLEMYRANKSLKQIATKLAQRRHGKRIPKDRAVVAWQKVRRKLIELGEIKSSRRKQV